MKKTYEDMIPLATQENQKRIDSANEIFENPEYTPEDQVIMEIEGGDTILLKGADALQQALDPEFTSNLAFEMDEDELDELCNTLIDKFEEDKEAREGRDRQYEQGLRKAGLSDDASTGGADFEGASRVTHPMISKNCVDFSARSARELCPPSGPLKMHIIGEATSKKVDEAQRKAEFMNELTLNLMPYRGVFQQMLSQLPLGGSQFMKFWHDTYLKRPNCEFLPIDNVYIPFNCNDFYTAERVTIKTTLSSIEYWRRVKSGIYYDPDYIEKFESGDDDNDVLPISNDDGSELGNSGDYSRAESVRNKIEGKQSPDNEEDGYTIYEMYVYLNLEGDTESMGDYAPYIVTIREEDNRIIGLYRNWKFGDKRKQKLDYIVKFDFIPWSGAYGIGLPQLIGSLSTAATGALRALLDSAHVNNAPTGLALKGLKMSGQAPDVAIGSLTFLEGPNGMEDDIRKCIMPLPFNPPSPTLYQLLEWLTGQADQVVKMPDGTVNSMGDRTPANTTLAIIEQGSTTQSSIHANLHFAQQKCFEIIGRLLKDHFDEEGYPEYLLEELKINGALFQHTRDIVPVSDPNIFCEVQRYAQIQAVMDLAKDNPQAFNMTEIYKRALQLLKLPEPDMLLNIPVAVSKSNAVAENAAVMLGNQIQVYPDQDHLAHLLTHLKFLEDPIFGQNPAFNQNTPQFIDHLKEHLVYFYTQVYQQLVKSVSDVDGYNIHDEDIGAFDETIAEVTPDALMYIQQKLGPYIQEAQQMLQSLMQLQQQQAQNQMNPEQIKLQIEQAKLQQTQATAKIEQEKLKIEQVKVQNETQKVQVSGQESQSKMQLEQQKIQSQTQVEMMRMQIEKMRADSEIEMTRLQGLMEKDESQAMIYVELMRLEQQKLDNLAKLQLQREKNHMDIQNDREKHEASLETQQKVAKNSTQEKKE